jgi:capsule polysaccharide export protein KpsE/RkpR
MITDAQLMKQVKRDQLRNAERAVAKAKAKLRRAEEAMQRALDKRTDAEDALAEAEYSLNIVRISQR